MILFPNAKINLGLNVVARRHDGYHDVETAMVAVDWTDILEIVPAKGHDTSLTIYGRAVDCPVEKNLVMKAYRAMEKAVGSLPPADIYLEKIIPDGAGLGGGSADAAFTLLGLNEVFGLGLEKRRLAEIASEIGADCPFFIYDTPAYCTGTGTDISHEISVELKPYTILIAKPRVAAVSTKEAYAGIVSHPSDHDIRHTLGLPIGRWQELLTNDFEASVFPRLPQVAALKERMLAGGALYAAMSGSGASVFGIFENDILAQSLADTLPDCDVHVGKSCQ